MVDHRRTPSQRAYRLPGWFFVLTGLLSLLGLATAVVVVADVPLWERSPQGTPRPLPSPSATATPTAEPSESSTPSDDNDRSGVEVVVLNATSKKGLAADVADLAEKAGWTIAEIGNWPYPAAQNAVFYPQGHQAEGELLGEDLAIKSVRPARPGMSTDKLTVILLNAP